MSADAELKKFYRPYLSDSDSDYESDSSGSSSGSGTSSGSGSSTESEKASVKPSQLAKLSPNLFSGDGAFINEISEDNKVPFVQKNAAITFNQTNLAFVNTKLSSSIMLNSTDRDTNIFPQPSSFSIRLPRVYRNVSSISVSQIKMLSSFYYFSDTKNNTSMRIQELGRLKTENGTSVNNTIDVFIRNGSYDVNSLVLELNNQLNSTPLYNIISKDDFFAEFTGSGDYNLLFNPPGDTTYNNLTGVFETLASITDIVSRYFNTTGSLGTNYIPPDEVLVAYYYPMLKDLTILQVPSTTPSPVNPYAKNCSSYVINNLKTYLPIDYAEDDATNKTYLNGNTAYDRIIYGFQGLSDPYVLSVIKNTANQAILDSYKADNTWFNYLVNRYVCSYDANAGRLTIYSKQLNTSIATDLTTQYTNILTKELVKSDIDPGQIATIQANAVNLNGSAIDMYNFIQRQFSTDFAINYGLYSREFYTDFSNKLNISDASGRYGWSLIYQNEPQISSDKGPTFQDLSGYWPLLALDARQSRPGSSEYYCDNPLGPGDVQYTFTKPAIADSSGNILLEGDTESNLGYQDLSVNINPTTYFKTSFKSRCRQTVYIAVTPPQNDAISEQYYDKPADAPLLFDTRSNYLIDVDSPNFKFFDISQNLLDGADFMRSIATNGFAQFLKFVFQTKPSIDTTLKSGALSLFSFRNTLYFKINHAGYPIPLALSGNEVKFDSDIYIEREDGNPFGSSLDVYWYRDRAAFMADANNYTKNIIYSNPKHYFSHTVVKSTDIQSIITQSFISYDSSYLLIRAKELSNPIPLRIFVIRHDDYGIYTIANISDLRKLPIDPDYLASKTNPFLSFPSELPLLTDSVNFRNNYDTNNVSNNLLNYNIINPDALHYDPYNFENNTDEMKSAARFVFQLQSKATLPGPAIDAWSQYFYTGSQNQIIDISSGKPYYNSVIAASDKITGSNNEYVFTNWFRAGANTNLFTYYNSSDIKVSVTAKPIDFPEQTILPLLPQNDFQTFSYGQAGSSANSPFPICFKAGNPLNTDISFNQFILSSSGCNEIMGIPFLPPSGSSVVPNKIIIKFAYIQPNRDDNNVYQPRSAVLYSTSGDNYKYGSYASDTAFTGMDDLNLWDDKFIANRKNTLLGVFRMKDVIGKKTIAGNNLYIDVSNALCTLTLKKITQVGEYVTTSSGLSNNKARAPDWGTYYIYEKNTEPKNILVPVNQSVFTADGKNQCKTQWAVFNQPGDIVNGIQMSQIPAETEASQYYSDVSNNALCFIPFYTGFEYASGVNPNLPPFIGPTSEPFPNNPFQSAFWKVGSFNGLTFTNRPYLPFSSCGPLAINPNIYFKGPSNVLESICVEDLSGNGIAQGLSSTYLGICGPICLGRNNTNTIIVPNNNVNTFFNVRVNLSVEMDNINPIKDIINDPNLPTCFANTFLFAYDSAGKDINDIKSGWGQENRNNWFAYDNNSGYNYLSYLNSFEVYPNITYSLNLRSYLPTTSLNCGLRIVAKNWSDFGYLSISDLISEINILAAVITLNPDGTIDDPTNFRIAKCFTYNYTRTLLRFNNKFKGTFIFGRGFVTPSYVGYTITSTGFSDFMAQYRTLSLSVKAATDPINTAQSLALSGTRDYIISNYTGILPDNVLQRNRYTDPLSFSILFKSALIKPYDTAFDQWGLGWNLGFDKVDTTFSTRCVASTFIRIVDDYIYLKLNDEFNCNSIDSTGKEDLSKNRDSFGLTKGYFGKLLLNTFGSFAQTFVQSGKPLPAMIAKMDQLRVSFFDLNGIQINNNDCEFNVVFEITENLDTLDINSSMVRGMGGLVPK